MPSLSDVAPAVLPPGWCERQVPQIVRQALGRPARVYHKGELKALMTVDDFDDGAGVWLHVSVSRPLCLPDWYDLVEVKEMLMGDRPAVQLLPPREFWINVHEHCLHLFARLDGDTVHPALYGGGA